MGTTPNYNIQYPDSGDQWDLINDLQALADTTDTAIDGVETSLTTFAANASNLTSGTVDKARLPNLESLNGRLTDGQMSPGSVLQVVHNSYATQVDNHTWSPVDTGLTATITPTSASSKILVMVTQAGVHKVGSSNIYSSVGLALLRGTTNLTTFEIQMGQTGSSMEINLGTASTVWLDSPATTSAITYKTTFYNNTNTSRVTVQYASSRSSIVLMEVAG